MLEEAALQGCLARLPFLVLGQGLQTQWELGDTALSQGLMDGPFLLCVSLPFWYWEVADMGLP